MVTSETALLAQLSANSDPYRDPLATLDWSRLDTGRYWLPPEALSLYGLAQFEALSEVARMRLSQYEFIAACQAGIALERIFLECTARRLGPEVAPTEYAYMLHEMREEAGHSLMFLRLIGDSGLQPPDWRHSLPATARLAARFTRLSPLYWFATVLAEDIPDKLNRYVRRHSGALVCPLIRQLVSLHLVDEARHIAYARCRLEGVAASMGRLRRAAWRPVFDLLFNRFVAAYFWPRPELYELAGLGDGAHWRSLALGNPRRREFVLALLAPTLRLFASLGLPLRLR